MAMTIFNSLANCLRIEEGKEFSPMKAFDYLKFRGGEIFSALASGVHDLGAILRNILL
jgi:hypothetical protein